MYENLPIFRKAMQLNVTIEEAVRGFSRYHKYSIGMELRQKARAVIYAIYKVYFATDKEQALGALRDCAEELKIIIYLAQELKALRDFKQFELVSQMARELARQSQGWLRSQSSHPSRQG
ncbi:MAG TPA: four helix bundle protein [Epsilonproteobacteria bacterium]|nr:four helix bundle protein [Campylobacterota bacterium]